MKQLLLFTTFVLLIAGTAKAQVGIGTTTPNSNAVLDLSSTNKGLLIPRMSSTQRTGIASGTPAKGMLVFDNDSAYFFYYDGSTWKGLKNTSVTNYSASNGVTLFGSTVKLGGTLSTATTIGTSSSNTLKLTGVQSGTTSDSIVVLSNGVIKKIAVSTAVPTYSGSNGVNVASNTVKLGGTLSSATTIGTSSTNTLKFTGVQSGSTSDSLMVISSGVLKKISSSSVSPWVHYGSYDTLATGTDNVGIGKSTPYYKLDVKGPVNADSIMIGGSTNLRYKNNSLSVGYGTGTGIASSAFGNTLVGYTAGNKTTTGTYNTAVGNAAGYNLTTSQYNSIFGDAAGYNTTTGSQNTFLGTTAGYSNAAGILNTFVGSDAGRLNTASYNTYIGSGSGRNNVTGTGNTFLGLQTGYNTTSSGNSIIGYLAGYYTTTGENNSFVGYYAGLNNTTGYSNTTLGTKSGYTNSTGNRNTLIGDSADVSSIALNNATAIGYNAKVGQSNSIVLGATGTYQPNVGIGTTTPSSNALLEMKSTTQGLLIPRMSSSQRTSISSPATGLLVFDTDSGYVLWYNSSWKGLKTYTGSNGLTSSGSSVKLGGNLSSATTIGTSSTNTLKLTGVQAGSSSDSLMVLSSGVVKKVASSTVSPWTHYGTYDTLATGTDYVGIGKSIPQYKLDVKGPVNADSVMLGGITMFNTKVSSINIGEGAGRVTTGVGGFGLNVFIGYNAGYRNTSGWQNTFIGYQAGYSNTNNGGQHFVGYKAGTANTSGADNHFEGYWAGLHNTTGSYNHFDGNNTGISNTTGSDNVFSGYHAGYSNTSANNNTAIGYLSGAYTTTGYSNTTLGANSGYSNTTGTRNTLIGDSADESSVNLTNATAIGYNAKVGQSNSIVLGATGTYQPNVGIGTSQPNSTALLEMKSTTQGLLIPRMSSSQRTSISSPATGLIVYDTDSGYVFFYNSGWKGIKSSSSISPNFWTRSSSNTVLANSSDKVGIGKTPSYKLDVSGPVNADSFMINGNRIIATNTGYSILALGIGAGTHLASGGANDVFSGYNSGYNNTTGSYNIFTGYLSGYGNSTGSYNTFEGSQAGYSNTTGAGNNYGGYKSGYSATIGAYNTFYGGMSGNNTTTGSGNVFIGSSSGSKNTTGTHNTILGDSADLSSSSLSNATAIGYNAKVTTSNSLVLGASARVGIGTSSPAGAKLEVNGGVKLDTLAGTGTRMVVTDANGLLSTQTISTSSFNHSGTYDTLATGTDYVGIGKLKPQHGLEVKNGISTDSSYMINDVQVLAASSKGNLFIGKYAGKSNTSGYQNTFTGDSAGYKISTGYQNFFGGYRAGSSTTTGYTNAFIGAYSGFSNSSGYNNSFLGTEAGYSNTGGYYNSFIGMDAGYFNTTGYNNCFVGAHTGYSNTTGYDNSFIGPYAGISNTTGLYNCFTGMNAGYSNTTGNNNSFSGYNSGYNNSTGFLNTALGFYSGYSNTTGYGNTAVGVSSGFTNGTGIHNTFIGDSADVSSSNLNNATAIGYNAKVSISNAIVLGNGSVNVGIGNSSPKSTLDLQGSMSVKRVTYSSSSTIAATDFIVGSTATSAITLTLPAAATAGAGRVLIIKRENSNTTTITIDGNSSEKVDGAANTTITTAYGSVKLYCDGSNWFTF